MTDLTPQGPRIVYHVHMEPDELISPMEIMARKLAAMAGVEWDRLRDYPGYERNHWRHEAEVLIDKMQWARLR